MNPAHRPHQGKNALEILEEATQLLRTCPWSVLASYYTGTLPFALGLLYFWTDMGRNPFAARHVVEGALGMALLFAWMKCWQVVFAQQLRTRLSGLPEPSWDWLRCGRILTTQILLQPPGLFFVQISRFLLVPYPWINAFYENLLALDDGRELRARALWQQAWRLAKQWPRQNILAILTLWVFNLFVFINWASFCFILPHLVKMLTGVESIFTQNATAMLNSTTFVIVLTLTYLSVDPIIKTLYVLRCFYGESLRTGDDLKAELKMTVRPAAALSCILAMAVFTASVHAMHATEVPIPLAPAVPEAAPSPVEMPVQSPPSQAVSSAALNQSITDVIHQDKFIWRMPKEKFAESDEESWIAQFFHEIYNTLSDWYDYVRDLWRKFWGTDESIPRDRSTGYGWITSSQLLLGTLIAVVAALLGVVLYRTLRNRARQRAIVQSQPMPAQPDLTDENVSADQLPEDGWTTLARELLARGEFRLALRAFYLSSLAHLAARQLIALAKFKSNRDYERELRRREHAFPGLPGLFGENVLAFDRSWYGRHEVNDELVRQFAAKVDRIKHLG
jgi:hypothetical protein